MDLADLVWVVVAIETGALALAYLSTRRLRRARRDLERRIVGMRLRRL